jgi:hypothetical protein
MKNFHIAVIGALLFAGHARAGEQSPFNGKDLTGWQGNTNVWRVQDGALVGGSLAGNPRNEFLATERSYRDFVLRYESKVVAPGNFNSGVQFRSVRITQPPNEMKGYQADIGTGYTGCLYDESRRNRVLVRPAADQIKRLEKCGEWNRYEVRCQGPHIQIFLNGERTVDYTEADDGIAPEGQIAVQVHGGMKQECWFRNITIEELPK